jgi:hypothetical protein
MAEYQQAAGNRRERNPNAAVTPGRYTAKVYSQVVYGVVGQRQRQARGGNRTGETVMNAENKRCIQEHMYNQLTGPANHRRHHSGGFSAQR